MTLARPVSCCSVDFNCTQRCHPVLTRTTTTMATTTSTTTLVRGSLACTHVLCFIVFHIRRVTSCFRFTELHGLPFKPHLPKLPKAPPMRPHFLPVPSKTTQKNKGSARICTFTPFDSRKPLIATVLIIYIYICANSASFY